MRKTRNFFIQSELHWHKYRLLRGRTISEMFPENFQLFGSKQYTQIRVYLTSFSTWRKENSLMEINLESEGEGVVR